MDFGNISVIMDNDDDQIFSQDDLDKIIALERAMSKESCDSREILKPATDTINTSQFRKPATPPSAPSAKKFKFKKPKPVSQAQQPSNPIPKLSPPTPLSQKYCLLDDEFNDDDFISDHDLEVISKLEQAAIETTTSRSSESLESFPEILVPDIKLPYEFPPPPGSVAADENWKKYRQVFVTRECFLTPWFQSMPMFRLNILSCRTIAEVLKDPRQLVQFGNKFLLPIMKELNESNCDREMTNEDYYKEVSGALEKVLVRFEAEFWDPDNLNESAENSDFKGLLESVFDSFLNQELDLSLTTIPEILVRLYHPALDTLISTAVNSGNEALILPLCASSQNLLTILNLLHSMDTISSTSDSFLEDSADFQWCADGRPKFRNFAFKLLDCLRTKRGQRSFIELLPPNFRSLYSIELGISMSAHSKALLKARPIAQQLLPWFNEVLHEDNQEFSEFLISILLPVTQTILQDRKLIEMNVKYRTHPNLWRYLRRKSWFEK